MSYFIDVTIRGVEGVGASRLAAALQDRSGLHAAMAQAGEKFVKDRGSKTAATEHESARRLGARPTGHLMKAYQAIESQSDASGARLLVPRASRLRAAFGGFTLRPTGGRTYLTIPVAKEAYGKRAKEFSDLEFMFIGPRRTPVLARKTGSSEILQVMYRLVKEITMKEDPGLIDFVRLSEVSSIAAEAWVDGIVKGGQA